MAERLSQAQKELWTRDASARALVSSQPWTQWLLRMVGSGSSQAIADLWGVVDVQRRTGRLAADKADALDHVIEQFVGAGTVDPATSSLVHHVFATDRQERSVMQLFLLHDRLASGDPGVTLAQIEAGVRTSDALGCDGTRAFFLAAWARHTAQAGNVPAAIGAAEKARRQYETLAAADAEYQDRLGETVALLRRLYGFVEDTKAVKTA